MPTAAVHPFRFGLLTTDAITAKGWRETAIRAEASGYSSLLVPDIGGPTLSPFPALAMAAAVTSTLRVGTWVMPNDLRNPVMVAREAATLDVLSDGRFELGLGAGRDEVPYASFGLEHSSGGVRLARLAEALDIIARLFRGETVSAEGRYYSIAEATLFPTPATPPRIAVAAGGRKAWELAARTADIVAVGGMLAPDMAAKRELLGDRDVELGLTYWAVPEGAAARQAMASGMARWGFDLEAMIAADAPRVLVGSTAAKVEQLLARREALGISYVVTSAEAELAPIISALAGR